MPHCQLLKGRTACRKVGVSLKEQLKYCTGWVVVQVEIVLEEQENGTWKLNTVADGYARLSPLQL